MLSSAAIFFIFIADFRGQRSGEAGRAYEALSIPVSCAHVDTDETKDSGPETHVQ